MSSAASTQHQSFIVELLVSILFDWFTNEYRHSIVDTYGPSKATYYGKSQSRELPNFGR